MTYLLKVRYSLSGLQVYKITTTDIYHSVGKLVLSSIEHIERIDYSEWSQTREDFWKEEGYNIFPYKKIEK